jgi:hypothetical protein
MACALAHGRDIKSLCPLRYHPKSIGLFSLTFCDIGRQTREVVCRWRDPIAAPASGLPAIDAVMS